MIVVVLVTSCVVAAAVVLLQLRQVHIVVQSKLEGNRKGLLEIPGLG